MSGVPNSLLGTVRRARQALGSPGPGERRIGLAERIATIADDLGTVIDDAAELRLLPPTAVTNAVLDLRAWSTRAFGDTTPRPTAVDATRLLTYVRTMSDGQLLALLADLPWPRLDALLDAINEPPATERPIPVARSSDQPGPPNGTA